MSRPPPKLAAVCLFVATTLFASAAWAQDDAFEHFDRGAELYFEGEYSKAIVEFKRGHEIEAHPMFHINIALAYWRLDNLEEAISYGELAKAKADQLEPSVRVENRARLNVWRATQRTRQIAETIRQEREAIARREAEQRAAAAELTAETETEPEPTSPFGPVGWAGVGTAGLGVVSLGVWSVLELSLDDEVVAYREAGEQGNQERYDALRAEIERKQRVARGALFAGIGLTAVGGGLIAYDLFAGGEKNVSLRLDPIGRRIGLAGSF